MVTLKEMAEKYGVAVITIRNWIEAGNIPTEWRHDIGKKPYIIVSEKAIEEFLENRNRPRG